MKQNLHTIWFVALLIVGTYLPSFAQKNIETQISDSLTIIANSYTRVGKVNVINFSTNTKTNIIYV
jgi:hypothetical protein